MKRELNILLLLKASHYIDFKSVLVKSLLKTLATPNCLSQKKVRFIGLNNWNLQEYSWFWTCRMQGLKQCHIPCPTLSLLYRHFSISSCCFPLDWFQFQKRALYKVAKMASSHSRSIFYQVIKFTKTQNSDFLSGPIEVNGLNFVGLDLSPAHPWTKSVVQGMESSTSNGLGLSHNWEPDKDDFPRKMRVLLQEEWILVMKKGIKVIYSCNDLGQEIEPKALTKRMSSISWLMSNIWFPKS